MNHDEKAAEGCRTPKTLPPRGSIICALAFWSGPVLWRFFLRQCMCCGWSGFYIVSCALSHTASQSAELRAPNLRPPTSFPHRIWASCDFEGRAHSDYAWFGNVETNSIPKYPGNHSALRANPG